MAQVSTRVEDKGSATFDVGAIVSEHHGPACLFDTTRRPVLANTSWLNAGLPGPDNLHAPDRDAFPGQLAVDLMNAAMTGSAGQSTIRLPGVVRTGTWQRAPVDAVFEFTILPIVHQGTPAFVALGTNKTATEVLQSALQESREFHRAFAACSADFIWQVDSNGVIDYSGPRGLLDFDTDDVFGSPIARFFTDRKEAEASLVFLSREPMWEREVWLSDKRGVSHCFLVSSVPVTSETGRWLGARGVAREVTEQREREAELKKARFSQRMVNSVLHAMRSEVDPQAILHAATIVAADTAELDACLVARTNRDGALEWVATTLPDPVLKAGFSESSDALLAHMQDLVLASNRGVTRYNTPASQFLIAVTSINGTANGAIAFGRNIEGEDDANARNWSPEDEHILRAMTEQLGISLAQYELVEGLRKGGRDGNGI